MGKYARASEPRSIRTAEHERRSLFNNLQNLPTPPTPDSTVPGPAKIMQVYCEPKTDLADNQGLHRLESPHSESDSR